MLENNDSTADRLVYATADPGLLAYIELVCRDCEHAFEVVTSVAIKLNQKRCPKCGSEDIRQTFTSYLRNGPLSSPRCGTPVCATYG
jgi:putative FmdB family regulatory protein